MLGNSRTIENERKKEKEIEKRKISYYPSVVIIDLFITINTGLRMKGAGRTRHTDERARD